MKWEKKDYFITTDKELFDLDIIYLFLSKSAYWCKGLPRKTFKTAINNSLCFGVFYQNKQVGFGRLITDYATFAYLADVFILEKYRGEGLSKFLMDCIMSYPSINELRRIMLATADAHSLYEKYHFKKIENPDFFMQIHKPEIYKKLEKA